MSWGPTRPLYKCAIRSRASTESHVCVGFDAHPMLTVFVCLLGERFGGMREICEFFCDQFRPFHRPVSMSLFPRNT